MIVAHAAAIWRGLIEIKDRGPTDREAGICRNLMFTSSVRRTSLTSVEMDAVLRECYASWALYSGNPRYPVPAPVQSPGLPGYAYYQSRDKWSGTSEAEIEYAKSRESLFAHIIECLYKVLSDNLSALRTP